MGTAGARRCGEFEYVEADSESYEERNDSEVGDKACRAEDAISVAPISGAMVVLDVHCTHFELR